MPAQAWRDAAEDLTITVVAPSELLDETGQIAAVAVAWVESFGSAQAQSWPVFDRPGDRAVSSAMATAVLLAHQRRVPRAVRP
jgi:hypothetical protein